MLKWISVRERLPKDHPRRCYLVCYVSTAHGVPRRPKRRVMFAIYSGEEWRFLDDQKTRLSERVSHWMPKPKPPRHKNPSPAASSRLCDDNRD